MKIWGPEAAKCPHIVICKIQDLNQKPISLTTGLRKWIMGTAAICHWLVVYKGGVEKGNNITLTPAETRGEIPSGAICTGKRSWQVIFQWFISTEALLRGSGENARIMDYLKSNQYLAYVMDIILGLKNRADLSSCRLPGLEISGTNKGHKGHKITFW